MSLYGSFKNIQKNAYKYWQILNYYLFGIEWCKLELDFNKEECTWFAFRIESFIDRHLCGVSCTTESNDVNFQPSNQYLFMR